MDNLVRTQVSLQLVQRKAMDQLAAWENVSMAEIVRRAIKQYLEKERQKQEKRKALITRLAGSLADSPTWKNINASAWQRKLRREKGI